MSLTLAQIVEVAAADTEFTPGMSSNELFYANQSNERLTDVIATIADEVLDKAATTHTHTEYAETDHTHMGYAEANHSHSNYASFTHTHNNYASSAHTHAQADITGLTDALATKADVTALTTKADLVGGKIPESQLPSYVDDVAEYTALANFPTEGESGKIYVDQTTNKTYRWSGTAYVEISASLALGETAATAYRGDLGKIAYDHSQNSSVHVTEAQKAAWDAKSDFSGSYNDLSDKPAIPEVYVHPANHPASMITGLSTVATSGSYNDLTNKPTIPEAYSHPASHPASMITGLAEVATSGSYNDLTNKPTIPTIPNSLPANGGNADTVDNMHASDFATASHTHTGYADENHTHSEYAAASHSHSGYADENHTHSDYADADHSHSEYFNANSGGSIGGDTNVNGVFRVQGQQAFYYNDTSNTQTIGTNNATGGTTIACGSSATVGVNGAMMKTPMIIPRANNSFTCGNANFRWSGIYSTAAVNVSSDERLKRDIEVVNADPLVEFIKNLNVVQYNYKDDPADAKARIGLIAQQVQKADPEVAEFFVSKDENEMLGLKAADLVFPLILAVQRLSAEIDELKSKM